MIKRLISLPYQIIHECRSWLYDLGIVKKKQLDTFVISVGNVSFGGTGKTPFTIELAKYLNAQGLKVGVITRAYKCDPLTRKTFPVIANDKLSVSEIGDEAFLMLQEFKNTEIKLILDQNRYRGGKHALEKFGLDVLILDDAMQHIQLKRDYEIVLQNSQEKGFYREFPSNATKKADLLLYSKTPKNSKLEPRINYEISLSREIDWTKEILAFSAIADPQVFYEMLDSQLKELAPIAPISQKNEYLYLAKTLNFNDHHFFSEKEVRKLLSVGMNLVCTQKDFVKIPAEHKERVIVANLTLSIQPVDLFNQVLKRIKNGTRHTGI